MGVDDRLSVPLTGVEVSPLYAHMGAYGIPYDPYGGAGGAIRLPELGADGRWFVSEMPILIERARNLGAQFIQINHPRASQGYFDHVGTNLRDRYLNLTPNNLPTTLKVWRCSTRRVSFVRTFKTGRDY